jgi:hypothetical protein
MLIRSHFIYLLLTGVIAALVSHLALTRAPSSPPPLRPSATVAELMRMHVDPSAGALFASVAFTVGRDGERERIPRSDEDWSALRRHALVLAESANLLLVPGRSVVGEHDARRHLDRMVWRDREAWNRHVGWMAEAAAWTLDAIDRRNAVRLQSHTGDIALTCELCHLHYRYPGASRQLALPDR